MKRFRIARASEESTAAGIYGVIVSAAVMAVSQAESAPAIIVGTLVTLLIYWGAERYSRLVAERIHAGHRPTWRHVRLQLTTGWEIVTASGLPLAALTILSLLGTELDTAVTWALVCSTGLLCLVGWEIGRQGQLTKLERLGSAVVATMFGLVLISLKSLLH